MTAESKAKIDEARAAFNALSKERKAMLSTGRTLNVLTDAETAYANMLEVKPTDKPEVRPTDKPIDSVKVDEVVPKIDVPQASVVPIDEGKETLDTARTADEVGTSFKKGSLTYKETSNGMVQVVAVVGNKTLKKVTIPANMESEVYLPLLSKKYEIKNNGSVQKTTRVKDAPFISLGTMPSGTYVITMTY